MITKMSSAIAKWLLHAGAISESDRELYEYAAYSFLFSLLPLCLIVILGCITGMVIEGLLMILPFMLIRKFSGGFHLKSPGICLLSSTLLLSAFLFIIRFRFLYKGIIIKHNKTEPTYTKTSLFLCEKRRFFMGRTEKGGKVF